MRYRREKRHRRTAFIQPFKMPKRDVQTNRIVPLSFIYSCIFIVINADSCLLQALHCSSATNKYLPKIPINQKHSIPVVAAPSDFQFDIL